MFIQGAGHFVENNAGIEAGPLRAAVQDADDRQGIGVADAGGEIAFAGDGKNKARPPFDDDLARQGAAGGDGNGNPPLLRQFRQVIDIAAAAAHTFVDIAGDFDRAVEQLDAVRQENQRLLRR